MADESVFGAKLTALMILIGAVYFLLSFAPVIWPAICALRHKNRLQRPWLFITAVACLTYGFFNFLIVALLRPAVAYSVFVAPSLEAAGRLYGPWLVQITRWVTDYWWIALPPIQLFLTVFVT